MEQTALAVKQRKQQKKLIYGASFVIMEKQWQDIAKKGAVDLRKCRTVVVAILWMLILLGCAAAEAPLQPDDATDAAITDKQTGEILEKTNTAAIVPMGVLSMTVEAADWSWVASEEHTALITLTNTGTSDLTAVTVTLQPVMDEGRNRGEATIVSLNGESLKKKTRGTSYTLETLACGETITLGVSWTAPANMAGVEACTLTASARCQGAWGVLSAADALHMVKPETSNIAASTVLALGMTVNGLMLCLGGVVLALFALAALAHQTYAHRHHE